MPAALLFLLLAATIDARLAEPLRLLAEVGARDTTDGHLGTCFARSAHIARPDAARSS
jgi:hypothetical protein